MSVVRVPGSADRVNHFLEEMFRGHGVAAVRGADRVTFPDHPGLWANGEAFNPLEYAVQMDYRLGLADGRVLVESVAGIGRTLEAQLDDGLKAFASATFHVLLAAFFDQPLCHGTDRFGWEVGGRPRDVFLGVVQTRFGFPLAPDGEPDLRFFGHFRAALAEQPLPPGTHWVRLYQMRSQGRSTANEVLLDNGPWPALQDAMAGFDWPPEKHAPDSDRKHYDVRVFMVIRDPA